MIGLILFAGFGIRSYMIGIIGAVLLFNIDSIRRQILTICLITLAILLLKDQYFINLIYDTRFYSYANAFKIVQIFPFRVGLMGYPFYTDIFNGQIFVDFYNVNTILNYVPITPESDYVHQESSLG